MDASSVELLTSSAGIPRGPRGKTPRLRESVTVDRVRAVDPVPGRRRSALAVLGRVYDHAGPVSPVDAAVPVLVTPRRFTDRH
jgi:hypothetical protein